jgi:aspartokinase
MAANGLVTIFRSADADAEQQASVVCDMLANANISAEIFDDSAPGVPEGVVEVRVPADRQADAEQLMEIRKEFNPSALDLSHDLDMVAAFASDAPNAEMIAAEIRSILESQGIPSMLVSGTMFPSLPFEVRVPRANLEEARRAIASAEEAGPAAADEAELESEGGS